MNKSHNGTAAGHDQQHQHQHGHEHEHEHEHVPLNLADAAAAAAAAAAAVDISSFAIDPSLSVDLFADPTASVHDAFHHHDGEHGDGHEPTQEDIHAVIQASLEAQVRANEQQANAHHDNSTTSMFDGAQVDDGGQEHDQAIASGSGSHATLATASEDPQGHAAIFDAKPGEEHQPITDPVLHLAPFNKPSRDENTPHPEYYLFASREKFTQWLEAESSWCHYVQRRTTTPDKRSAERFQARIRAHNRQLESMTPDERAAAPPLKTRRRNRVSPVLEKVTFTCHHAGSYESKHSSTLPKEKLRLNTKKSVKCACASRVVLSEMNGGECKVVFHWKHEGHDPFSDEDTQGGRLPKAIDVWLNRQIEADKTLDDIRKVLMMPEEDKQAYLTRVQADPTSLDPDMPPPLAMVMQVKYPDIYNRYRKLKGPVKENKVLKGANGSESGVKRTASGTTKAGHGGRRRGANETGSSAETGTGTASSSSTPGPSDLVSDADNNRQSGVADAQQILDPSLVSHHQHQNHKFESNSTNDNTDTLGVTQPDFSSISLGSGMTGPHEGLARALLELPSSGGLRDEDGNEMSLEEAMRRMAEGVQHGVHDVDGDGGVLDGDLGVGVDVDVDVDVDGMGMQ
ncbi:hypothetical protein IAU59_007341 [Kwoniella sp. CBS 9459]